MGASYLKMRNSKVVAQTSSFLEEFSILQLNYEIWLVILAKQLELL